MTEATGTRHDGESIDSAPSVEPPARLVAFLRGAGVDHAFVEPGVPMPTVALAAAAIGVADKAILKTLVFVASDGRCVAAIACGTGRIDRRKLAAAIGVSSVKMAPPEVILRATGYPAGGVAPVGHVEPITVVIDRRVMELPEAWGGGGDERLLLRLRPADIRRLTGATNADLLPDPE
jgi:Cys-tRNA(Pro) deacylase